MYVKFINGWWNRGLRRKHLRSYVSNLRLKVPKQSSFLQSLIKSPYVKQTYSFCSYNNIAEGSCGRCDGGISPHLVCAPLIAALWARGTLRPRHGRRRGDERHGAGSVAECCEDGGNPCAICVVLMVVLRGDRVMWKRINSGWHLKSLQSITFFTSQYQASYILLQVQCSGRWT